MSYKTNDTNKLPVIINNSPINFILIGPDNQNKVRVLVKGDSTGPEILGEYINREKRRYEPIKKFGINISPEILFIDYKYSENDRDNDIQEATTDVFIFVWSGFCTSKSDLKKIKEIYRSHLMHIVKALENNDESKIEWELSSLLAFCLAIDNKHGLNKYIKKIICS